jgi:hypothetical protein
LICYVCQATGWRWDDVEDQLTIPRLCALARFWTRSPPPHVLLALIARAVLPVHETVPAATSQWQELAKLAAQSNSGLSIRGKPPL